MISTGVYHYPHDAAAVAAIEAIINWMVQNPGQNIEAKIVPFDSTRQRLYLDLIQDVILHIITFNTLFFRLNYNFNLHQLHHHPNLNNY